MPWRWLALGAVVIALALLFGRKNRADAVRVPTDPNEVLERVASATPGVKALRALEAALREQPQSPERAVAVATAALELAHSESDPRYWGRAQAALQAWWLQPDAPGEVLRLRAVLRQEQHDFDAARADLQQLTERDPNDAQAWRALADVERVTGDYDGSRAACTHVGGIVAATCHAEVDGLTGHAAAAIDRVKGALSRGATGPDADAAHAVHAVLLERAGQDEAAEAAYASLLQRDPTDVRARYALADLLQALNRPNEMEQLLTGRLNDDRAVLRLAIAERQKLGHPGPYAQMLEARYRESDGRNDGVNLREQARFALEVKADADRALAIALRNFEVQKEPADLRIVMMAALAAGKPDAAREAADFVLETGAQEPRLVALAKKVRP